MTKYTRSRIMLPVHFQEALHEVWLLVLGVGTSKTQIGRLSEVDKETDDIVTKKWIVRGGNQDRKKILQQTLCVCVGVCVGVCVCGRCVRVCVCVCAYHTHPQLYTFQLKWPLCNINIIFSFRVWASIIRLQDVICIYPSKVKYGYTFCRIPAWPSCLLISQRLSSLRSARMRSFTQAVK